MSNIIDIIEKSKAQPSLFSLVGGDFCVITNQMDNCAICYEPLNRKKLNDTQDFIVTKCNHRFHPSCLKDVKNNKCPVCRSNII